MSESKQEAAENIRESGDPARERAAMRQRMTELESLVGELTERIQELEARAPDPGDQAYDAMDKSDKATVVRDKLYKQALATNGKDAIDYKDVMRIFDGNPSPGHAYDIMEKAGNAPGYNYADGPDGGKRLEVVAGETEREN